MSYEEKLFEVFKQMSFLHLEMLKSLPQDKLDELYNTRPFQEETPDEENHDEFMKKHFSSKLVEDSDDIPECIKQRRKGMNLN